MCAPPGTVSLAAQTYNGWFIGSGFEYAFDWLPISGLFLKTEFRYSQYGGNGVSVPIDRLCRRAFRLPARR